ncbi:peptide deformylase [Rickettsiales bacterium LUAb2]
MAKLLKILKYPHPILKTTAKEITTITPEIKKLAENMLFTMYKSNGIGLAANQVGILERIVVIDIDSVRDDITKELVSVNPLVLINPKILERSAELFEYEEGCLSLPDISALLNKRAKKITVSYLDIDGNQKTMIAEDLLSVCIQHEIDHLDGILFIDHLSKLKKDTIVRKYNRQQNNNS